MKTPNPYTDPTLAVAWRKGYINAIGDPRNATPFELLAAEFNRLGNGDLDTPSASRAWEAYDAGVAAAIRDQPELGNTRAV